MTKTSEEVFKIVDKVSIVGFVLECLKTHSDTEKERYEKLKSTVFQTGVRSSEDLQKQVKMFVDQKETVVVAFSKKKSNAKVGCTKQFNKGFAYYVGENPTNLVKHYVHWQEEKKFLLGNIKCLNADVFFVETLLVNYATNLSVLHVSLSTSVDKELLGEFSLYFGHTLN